MSITENGVFFASRKTMRGKMNVKKGCTQDIGFCSIFIRVCRGYNLTTSTQRKSDFLIIQESPIAKRKSNFCVLVWICYYFSKYNCLKKRELQKGIRTDFHKSFFLIIFFSIIL